MTRIRSVQQDEWDDAFWNCNHEHRKEKARKARHKGLKSSTIRKGIEDYFGKDSLQNTRSGHYPDFDEYNDFDDSDFKPRI